MSKTDDKFVLILPLETAGKDVSSFKHHRPVEHRKGPVTRTLTLAKSDLSPAGPS